MTEQFRLIVYLLPKDDVASSLKLAMDTSTGPGQLYRPRGQLHNATYTTEAVATHGMANAVGHTHHNLGGGGISNPADSPPSSQPGQNAAPHTAPHTHLSDMDAVLGVAHCVAPATLYVPSGHKAHDAAPAALNRPGGQMDPVGTTDPVGHA